MTSFIDIVDGRRDNYPSEKGNDDEPPENCVVRFNSQEPAAAFGHEKVLPGEFDNLIITTTLVAAATSTPAPAIIAIIVLVVFDAKVG